MQRAYLFAIGVLFSTTALAQPASYTANVVGVTDGDTVTVLTDGNQQVKIRLHGIDAPESHQDFGTKAKQELSTLIFGEYVTVQVRDVDRYGRTVADIVKGSGLNVNQAMVRRGFAWWYEQYARGDTALEQAQDEARSLGRGLWADPNPIPPWEFRNGKSSTSNTSNDHVTSTAPTRGSPAVSQPTVPAVAPSNDGSGQVYITNTGKKFHGNGCRHLSKSKIPIARKDAEARGYGACSVCGP